MLQSSQELEPPVNSAQFKVQISPYLPPKETARALRDSLLSYRVCSWSDLLENLWETQETPIDLGLRRSRVEIYVHPAAYCFEGGNIERYSRLSKEARNGGDLAVTATLWLKIIPLPPVTLRARAQFCLSKDNVIVSDADPFLIAISNEQRETAQEWNRGLLGHRARMISRVLKRPPNVPLTTLTLSCD